MLDTMKQWLQTFPDWEGDLQLAYADQVPGNAGLYPRGMTQLSRREDVLGNVTVRWGCNFLLRRWAAAREDNARWLLRLQQWIAQQEQLGLTPKFGDDPASERMRAFEGKLDQHSQTGSALYTLQLQAEYTKIYRGE